MASTDWEREMNNMVAGFERQATFSLNRIDQCFERSGQTLNEEFKKHFLRISNERLATTYTKVQMNLQWRKELRGFVHESSAQGANSLENAEPVPNDSSTLFSVKSENAVVEIINTSDEEDAVASNVLRSRGTKAKTAETDPKNSVNSGTKANELASNRDGSFDELNIKVEKQEVIDENIPIRTFDPRGDSMNDESGSVDVDNDDDNTNGNGAESVLASTQTEMATGTSSPPAQKPSTSKVKNSFKCQHCKYVATQKGNLNMHLRTHTGERPFQCSRCFKRFTTSSSLKGHMKTHKNEFPFHCRKCFKGFMQENQMDSHESVCKQRRYECHLCMKSITLRKRDLEKHMRTHTGEKPFRCEICMKCFTQKPHLKTHLNTIHNRNNQ